MIKFKIMYFSPASCRSLPFRFTYSPKRPVLISVTPHHYTDITDKVLHPQKVTGKVISGSAQVYLEGILNIKNAEQSDSTHSPNSRFVT